MRKIVIRLIIKKIIKALFYVFSFTLLLCLIYYAMFDFKQLFFLYRKETIIIFITLAGGTLVTGVHEYRDEKKRKFSSKSEDTNFDNENFTL